MTQMVTRLVHWWRGHRWTDVQFFPPPQQYRVWCPGCRRWLKPGESGRLYGARAVDTYEAKTQMQGES